MSHDRLAAGAMSAVGLSSGRWAVVVFPPPVGVHLVADRRSSASGDDPRRDDMSGDQALTVWADERD